MKIELFPIEDKKVSFNKNVDISKDLTLDSPAIEFMTDFEVISPVTIDKTRTIDEAINQMHNNGVRSLLVMNHDNSIIGVFTNKDAQSVKVLSFMSKNNIRDRDDVSVNDIMTPTTKIHALLLEDIQNTRLSIRDVLTELSHLHERYILVISVISDTEVSLKGMISASNIGSILHDNYDLQLEDISFSKIEKLI